MSYYIVTNSQVLYSRWKFITLTVQYTTLYSFSDHNGRVLSFRVPQLNSHVEICHLICLASPYP
jgi:hypothetical protein